MDYKFDEMTEEERLSIPERFRFSWEIRLRLLEIPRRYTDACLTDFNETVQKLEGQAVLIVGETGTGKTHLLVSLAKRQITIRPKGPTKYHPITQKEIVYARFISVPELISKFHGAMTLHSEETEADIFDDYANAEYLYLDDFGGQYDTDWAQALIYRIIDHRYANLLPTSISTNVPIDFLARQNPRVFSRLVSESKIVELTGDDLRLKNQQA